MEFKIDAYKKVGPLRFGMSQQEAEKAVGHIDRVVNTPDGIIELYNFLFDVVAQVQKNSDQLIEVGFGHRATGVSLNDIRFFEQSQQEVLSELYKIDSNAFIGHGAIVFLNLGVSLTGFQSDDDNTRAITAFAKGGWDDIIPSMKTFAL